MSLGLSHSLSRHKLKFSPDKVDTMIVQAIALLDDLDKELNTYAMRVKEWYGWHFPELSRILNDNLAYAKVVGKLGMRSNAANADLAEVLPEEIETAVKAAAEVSMGTEITTEDLDNIQALAEQVVSFTEYRQQLSGYLSARMTAIAPNLTALVGELVGARLIAHAGSLMNLAKSPASTIQILGAEKALFRALKTKHDTPKYGLIYHASLVGQATGKNKGKIARILATKAALGLRVDALADWSAEGEGKGDMVPEDERSALGVEARIKIERRLAALEGRPLRPKGVAIGPNGVVGSTPGKWEVKEARKYNPDADGLAGDEPASTAIPETKSGKDKAKTPEVKEVKMIEEVEVNGNASEEEEEEEEEEEDDDEKADEPKEAKETDEMEEDQDEDEDEDEGDEDEDEDEDEDDEEEQDVEMVDEPVVEPTPTPKPMPTAVTTTATNGTATNGDDKSETISTVSEDTPDSPPSPTQQEQNWQSSIKGNTKDAKKARKKERHARRLAMSEEKSKRKAIRNAKLARKLDRKERRLKKQAQLERREERDEQVYGKLARQAGLSIARYKRKHERGEIKFNADGTPKAISKKDMKKARKEAEKVEKATSADAAGTKRKREDAAGETAEKTEKKKKRTKSSD